MHYVNKTKNTSIFVSKFWNNKKYINIIEWSILVTIITLNTLFTYEYSLNFFLFWQKVIQNQTLQWAIYEVLHQSNSYESFWEEVLILKILINILLLKRKLVKISKAWKNDLSSYQS